jgi:hypothetical protein
MANLKTSSRLRHWRRDRISLVEVKIIASDWREKRPNSIKAIPMPAPQLEQGKQRRAEESKRSKWWWILLGAVNRFRRLRIFRI